MQFFLFLSSLLLLASCGPQKVDFPEEIEAQLPEKVDFNLHVKPILSDRCFACHGPDVNKRAADLRLDIEENALAALKDEDDQFAIVPHYPKKSALYHRITSNDPEVQMPPPESNLTISAEEVAVLTRWIEQGAEYKPHWSFIKPEMPPVPELTSEWPNNEVDHFVLAKLQQKDFSPSERANKEKLIRRVTFDLTGLPPTVAEVDQFLADTAPDAYEKLVDRLLASPHYGERMATEWLDVARYADSHGYQDDGMRNMWPWRDWVIQSFNKNMPYDQFITWQLAGDMLSNATPEQKLASGFNRNHLQSQEGGIVSEEYRVEYVADRANTLGKAFLGLTVECARCHDHKYDPISQKEYYSLYAFFNSINETGQIPYLGEASPTIILTDKEVDEQLSFVQEKMREQEKKLEDIRSEDQPGFAAWLKKVSDDPQSGKVTLKGQIGHYPLDAVFNEQFSNAANSRLPADMVVSQQDKEIKIVEGKKKKAIELVGDSYVDLGRHIGYFERNEPFTISLWFKALKDSIKGPVFTRAEGEFSGNRGYMLYIQEDRRLSIMLNHTWPANSIEVHTTEQVPVGEWIHVALTYDGSSQAEGITLFINGQRTRHEVINDHLKRSIKNYGSEQAIRNDSVNFQIGHHFDRSLEGAVIDEFSIFDRELSAVEIAKLHGTEDPILTFLEAQKQQDLLEHYLHRHNTAYQKTLAQLTRLRGQENRLYSDQPEVMVMEELPEPRSTFVLDRGAYDAPTDQVYPTTPVSVMKFPEDLPRNRLGLAQWLIDKDNPLTARVAVNRYWQMLFGRGIVKTSDDFGNQGELPSHPELLDWLAIRFRESGWDVKALLRMLVTSATYQQSSVATPEMLEKDYENVWLAHGPSYRMPAEMIRDNALVASGLFADTIGGPSVKPYQPEGLWKQLATRNATEYVQDTGANLYRRGLYTVWKRSSPPPSMNSFDASDKYLCTVKRQKTNTPLQALVLLNDPQYVEAARVLAERMMKEGGKALEEQINFGFKALTSREPDDHELALLKELYQEEQTAFSQAPAQADSLLTVGEHLRDTNLPADELAALTVVANTLINYDEAVYKR